MTSHIKKRRVKCDERNRRLRIDFNSFKRLCCYGFCHILLTNMFSAMQSILKFLMLVAETKVSTSKMYRTVDE